MRVKRLEIQGFKSFKDKTIIHFDHTITGIVGPNGCGKSNIVDAFFWVMGEQSYKHMRGNSSSDLIFNGSSKYAPLGLAEATLVLETGAHDLTAAPSAASIHDVPFTPQSKEISVTRRLYRSGEGEYLINGVTARLKDIQELFMDTGVGAKGYSVIEQGQIGKIVNAKPEERRLLIEEAAGIAKYKARKKESLKKMEATQDNMARLNDILKEIEKNMGSLERQAQKAILYQKYRQELTAQELAWGRRKFLALSQKFVQLESLKLQWDQDWAQLRSELSRADNLMERDQIESLTLSKEIEARQGKLQDDMDHLFQVKSQLELARRRKGDLASQQQVWQDEKSELEEAMEAAQEQLQAVSEGLEEVEERFEQVATSAGVLSDRTQQQESDYRQLRLTVEQSKKARAQDGQQLVQLSSQLAASSSRAEVARERSQELAGQQELQQEKVSAIASEILRDQERLSEIEEQQSLGRTQREAQAALIQTQEGLAQLLERELQQKRMLAAQLQTRMQSLEEMNQAHEGMGDASKALLAWAKSQEGSGGVGGSEESQVLTLADCLEMTPGYETPLQAWLESQPEQLLALRQLPLAPVMQDIQAQALGRVGVTVALPLAAQAPRQGVSLEQASAILSRLGVKVLGPLQAGVAGVKHHPAVQLWVQETFAQVILVESLLTLEQWMDSEELRALTSWAMVDQAGLVVKLVGAQSAQGIAQGVSQGFIMIRGGSLGVSGAVGALKRKVQIQTLTAEWTQVQQQVSAVEASCEEALQQVECLAASSEQQQGILRDLEMELAGLKRDLHQKARISQEGQKLQADSLKEWQSHQAFLSLAQQEQERLQHELDELQERQAKEADWLANQESLLLEAEESLNEQRQELQGLKIQEAELREKKVAMQKELAGMNSVLQDRKRRCLDLETALHRSQDQNCNQEAQESELAAQVERWVAELGAAKEQQAELKNQFEQVSARVNQAMAQTKDLRQKAEQKQTQTQAYALELEKLTQEINYLVVNLEEKYGKGCLLQAGPTGDSESDSANVNARPEDAAAEEWTQEVELTLIEGIERLRERLKRLGEVNLLAIEEYESAKERFQKLQSERVDLETSLKNLEAAIEHINQTSAVRFQKAFDAIAERFEKLFPVVFGGGTAKMSLLFAEGSTDVLEAGVDILAQPPGKKISNMTLLSGGEKALTAVSLIFAIFMVKPSPFCVLDEVDAPLDDANIGKFNALLKEISVKSQFILITHNKKTMELNDTLYGVTMEEPGVSKMVSIELV